MDQLSTSQSWPFAAACGCNLETGRCATHLVMMQRIHLAWFEGSVEAVEAVERHCNGFGAGAGSLGDWSGVRDSTPVAVEAMFAAVLKADLTSVQRSARGLCAHAGSVVCDGLGECVGE